MNAGCDVKYLDACPSDLPADVAAKNAIKANGRKPALNHCHALCYEYAYKRGL
jgi:hypothetical protein